MKARREEEMVVPALKKKELDLWLKSLKIVQKPRLRIFQWNLMAIWRWGTTAVGYHQVIGEKVRLESEIHTWFAFVFMKGDEMYFGEKSEENWK